MKRHLSGVARVAYVAIVEFVVIVQIRIKGMDVTIAAASKDVTPVFQYYHAHGGLDIFLLFHNAKI